MNRVVVISEPLSAVHAEKEHLVVLRAGKVVRDLPLTGLGEVLCIGRVEVTAAALWRCLRHGVRVVLMTRDGRYLGRLAGPQNRNGDLRLAQYRTITDPGRALAIARDVVHAKIHNQRVLLQRRQVELRDPDIALALIRMRRLAQRIAQACDVDEVRGLEGAAAQAYFGVFGRLIKNPLFEFTGRNRRPPRDPVNALLSFGYTVVGAILEGDVEAAGLDPALGCLHAPAYGRPSLMLDLLEEFRPILVDSVVLRLLNRRQLVPTDFGPPEGALQDDHDDEGEADEASPGEVIPALAAQAGASHEEPRRDLRGAVYLRGPGRKAFLAAILSRLRERVHDPAGDGTFELRAILRNQVYRMARAFVDPDCPYPGFRTRQ